MLSHNLYIEEERVCFTDGMIVHECRERSVELEAVLVPTIDPLQDKIIIKSVAILGKD